MIEKAIERLRAYNDWRTGKDDRTMDEAGVKPRQVTEDIENLGKAGYVFFSTIKAFKGLEAENVILIHADIPGRIAALEEEDLYVACSRATGRLAILTNSDEALSWYSR